MHSVLGVISNLT